MKKKLTYVITLSEKFPKRHFNEGKPTKFFKKIEKGKKIHTIRKNFDWWEKRFQKIAQGKAVLSVRKWTGKPNRSKQEEIFQLDHTDWIGIQKLNFVENDLTTSIFIDGKEQKAGVVARKDGLTYDDFSEWFKVKPPGDSVVIHFTKFRY